jgi:hypothetical protein
MMRYRGASLPWPVATVEITTFDLEHIRDALSVYQADGAGPTNDRISREIDDVLKRVRDFQKKGH